MKTKNVIAFDRFKRSGASKYNASTQVVDGIAFHSRKEAGYYQQLKLEVRTKLIKDFKRQVAFDLFAFCPLDHTFVNGTPVRVCRHDVDFLVTLPDGSQEVREVKGFATAEWDLKRKIFEANYPNIPYKVIR